MARLGTNGEGPHAAARNEVVLVGRVAAEAVERELPSGDLLQSFRVVVDRPPGPPRPGTVRQVSIDTLDCTAWAAGVRRTAALLRPGDVVQVSGALRRRFWRAGAGAASRTEVEVLALKRLARGDGSVTPRRRRAAEAAGQSS